MFLHFFSNSEPPVFQIKRPDACKVVFGCFFNAAKNQAWAGPVHFLWEGFTIGYAIKGNACNRRILLMVLEWIDLESFLFLLVYGWASLFYFAGGFQTDPVELRGPYLGQSSPGQQPAMFAPGFLSRGFNEREVSFSPDGALLYYWAIFQSYTVIFEAKQIDGVWQEPEVASFSGVYSDFEPAFSTDGRQLFFVSDRPNPAKGNQQDSDIWVMARQSEEWGEPKALPEHINSSQIEFFPSLTRDGTLYFCRYAADFSHSQVLRARKLADGYGPVEVIPGMIDSENKGANCLIDPNERFLLFPAKNAGGGFSLHISYRKAEDQWSRPQPLGLGPVQLDDGARLSPDGRFLFFSAARMETVGGLWAKPKALVSEETLTLKRLQRFHQGPGNGGKDIYWVSTSIFEKVLPQKQ